jgi:hypothetical protein
MLVDVLRGVSLAQWSQANRDSRRLLSFCCLGDIPGAQGQPMHMNNAELKQTQVCMEVGIAVIWLITAGWLASPGPYH